MKSEDQDYRWCIKNHKVEPVTDVTLKLHLAHQNLQIGSTTKIAYDNFCTTKNSRNRI